jgi:hypothetical protein
MSQQSVDSVTDVGKSRQELTINADQRYLLLHQLIDSSYYYCYQLKRNEYSEMRKCMLMSCAYSANLGGTGTIIGSGTNLVLKGVFKE